MSVCVTETLKSTPNLKLRYERERRAWSQQDVADKVGTTPLNVGRWERGVTVPGPHFRHKLCEVFEKSVSELGLVVAQVDPIVSAPTPQGTPIADSSITTAFSETPISLWNVPYNRNLLFTGREDILTQLRAALSSEDQPIALAQPQAISGLGGIGKTQTVIEYAYRFRDDYEAILWARADSHDVLVSDFLLIAALLNLPERNEQDQNAVVKAVLRWFDRHENWLLILDNADDIPMASAFIPSAGKGHVLLTTRSHSTGIVAQRVELDTLDKEDGSLFLLRRAKLLKNPRASLSSVTDSVRGAAQTIVEAVDGLPLALDQAGAYIEETGCTLADYLKFYKTRRNRLLRARGKSATGHPEPVATTWSLSFEKVEQANPAAAELLRLCAFLHPDEIPEAMIIAGAAELGPILQPVAEDEFELNEAIGELRKYSLIKRDPELKFLNMHRLVQAVIKDTMNEERQRQWAERTVRMVSQAFPDPKDVSSWSVCQQYLPHAQVSRELIEYWGIKSLSGIRLLYNVARYLKERAQYKDAESTCQKALTIREQIQGSDHLDVAENLNLLVDIYYALGKYEQMKPLIERAVEIQEFKLGPLHPDLAESLNNLGSFYKTQGQDEQAEPFLLRSLAIREQTLGPDHPELISVLMNLAAVYRDQGKYEQAAPLFQRALDTSEKALGQEHPQLAIVLSNFGGLYNEQRKYDLAEPLFRRALTIKEKLLGPAHPLVALDLNNLAMICFAQENYEAAEVLLLRTLSIHEQTLGREHPDTARTFKNLAKLYTAQGRYSEAESFYQLSLSIRQRTLGPAHPLVILTLQDYAILLRKAGRESEAADMEAQAQAIQAKQE